MGRPRSRAPNDPKAPAAGAPGMPRGDTSHELPRAEHAPPDALAADRTQTGWPAASLLTTPMSMSGSNGLVR